MTTNQQIDEIPAAIATLRTAVREKLPKLSEDERRRYYRQIEQIAQEARPVKKDVVNTANRGRIRR